MPRMKLAKLLNLVRRACVWGVVVTAARDGAGGPETGWARAYLGEPLVIRLSVIGATRDEAPETKRSERSTFAILWRQW